VVPVSRATSAWEIRVPFPTPYEVSDQFRASFGVVEGVSEIGIKARVLDEVVEVTAFSDADSAGCHLVFPLLVSTKVSVMTTLSWRITPLSSSPVGRALDC
jgi:hypothetical protein